MFQQRIVQIGNSGGIILPKSLMDELGVKIGNKITIEKHPGENAFVMSKGSKKLTSITPEFLRMLERVNKQYGTALKKLAQK